MPPRETRLTSFGPVAPTPVAAPVAPEAQALGVSQLVALVTRTLYDQPKLGDFWVRGEITNLKPPKSHWYFDLKDASCLVSCVMFASDAERVKFAPANGMEVLVRGRVGVWPQAGKVQVYVTDIQPVGKGGLQLAFEQTKARLQAEGLFAQARKRPIPRHPRVIGVVTSLQGAVLRDILRTATRRNPAARLLAVGARVQGEGAAEDLARGIERLNAEGSCDVLIVGRGGGSMEDLWSFNEERLVRAVAASRIPVISAVGHESDWSLCDLAADHRASTPTAAAETVAPDARLLLEGIQASERRLARALADLVPALRQDVDAALERAGAAMARTMEAERDLLGERVARLHALSPLSVLARGYAVVLRDGKVVRSPGEAPVGSEVDVKLHEGSMKAKVTKHGEE